MIGEALILAGALLTLVAAIGMIRFDEVFRRMHALSKASTLAVLLMLLGAAVSKSHPNDVTSLLIAAALQLLTSPLASNMISFATYFTEGSTAEFIDLDEPGEPGQPGVSATG